MKAKIFLLNTMKEKLSLSIQDLKSSYNKSDEEIIENLVRINLITNSILNKFNSITVFTNILTKIILNNIKNKNRIQNFQTISLINHSIEESFTLENAIILSLASDQIKPATSFNNFYFEKYKTKNLCKIKLNEHLDNLFIQKWHFEKVKIALIDGSIYTNHHKEMNFSRLNLNFSENNENEQIKKLEEFKKRQEMNFLEKLVKHGVDLIFISLSQNFSNFFLQKLIDYKILLISNLSDGDLLKFQTFSGAKIICSLIHSLDDSSFGYLNITELELRNQFYQSVNNQFYGNNLHSFSSFPSSHTHSNKSLLNSVKFNHKDSIFLFQIPPSANEPNRISGYNDDPSCSELVHFQSIFLLGPSFLVVNEIENIIHSICKLIFKLYNDSSAKNHFADASQLLTVGGCSVDCFLYNELLKYSSTESGKPNWILNCFARGFISPAMILLSNGKLDNPLEAINNLRELFNNDEINYKHHGICLESKKVENLLEKNILDPFVIKFSAIELACETVGVLLQIARD